MVSIDLRSRNQQFIALIDDKDKCFFLKTVIREESMDDELKSLRNIENQTKREVEVSSLLILIKFDDKANSLNI